MKKISVFLFILLISLTLVSALDFTAKTDTNVTVKEMRSPIKLILNITDAVPGKYNLYTLADLQITPSEIFQIPNGYLEKEFLITPNDNLNVNGYYTFTYTLNHRDVEKLDKTLSIKVLNLKDVLEISSEGINYDSQEISFYIQNKENITLKGLSAKFESILFEIQEKFDLKPFEKHIIKVSVDEAKLKKTSAGVYVIKSIFDTSAGDIPINGNLYLGEKKGIKINEESSGFFIKTKIIDKTNTGNILESIETRIEKNIFSRLFTTFNIEPTSIERDGFKVTYIFKKEKLPPSETFEVRARTNYLLPFSILIVLILAVFGVKRYVQEKVSLSKSVKSVRTSGGEFALKVTLRLKAIKSIENVSISDRIPHTVKLYKQFAVKPDKIDPETRRIHWNIGNLNAGEERIVSYIVYSKVGFVGKFILPQSLVTFKKEDKMFQVNSNNVFFMSDQIKGE